LNEFDYLYNQKKSSIKNRNSFFNISINFHNAINSGHANIDNSAEFFIPGKSSTFYSTKFEYYNKWLLVELEPYSIFHNGIFDVLYVRGSYQYNNNHNSTASSSRINFGFRQSRIVLHYKEIGFGYGNENHWWGPGFHSAIVLSSNAPSQKTFSFGTLSDLRLGNFSFGGKIIVIPYESNEGTQLFFSGIKSHISHHSKSTIITLGFHRTYLSGDFGNLESTTFSKKEWSILDAARLVIEPLFGQSKKDLDYTIPGTPGFDAWDEILTGYVKISFPLSGVEFYADVASDDNRGNLTDLKAHWDHTLGYQLGMTKITKLHQYNIFAGIEFLTTRVSNTFNPKFYRGSPNTTNYYAKTPYDYFAYQGRRMGAHSGSSSDDLIFIFGIGTEKTNTYVSYNKERHGIKSMTHPELKTEYVMSFNRKISDNHSAFITLEYEKINNFGFIQNNISVSKLVWIGYSFTIS